MIKTEALSFKYPDGTEALRNINLEVRDGEVMALMGGNGCGKTTLLKHIIGLLRPSSGKLWMDGRDMQSLKDEEIYRRVGMVFQDPNDQLFAATVGQDVAFGVVNLGLSPSEISRRTREALEMVEAAHLEGKAIHTLSFGQKRRIAIAGVLAMQPRLMLLDEPTSGLDPRSVGAVMKLLHRLNREQGVSMLMATHDVELVPLFCDRVGIMKQGAVVATGTPGDIIADTAVIRGAELRLPRVAHLAEILQKRDGMVFSGIPLTIGEARRELNGVLAAGGAHRCTGRSQH